MKTLLLLRHGKSDWNASFDHDAQRPLSTRGLAAAETIGRFITQSGRMPDLVLTSPAVRAEHTARLAHSAGGWDCPIEVVGELYGASPSTVLEAVQRAPAHASTVVAVGHQPTWSNTVSMLVGGGAVRFPTAAVACIELNIGDWTSIRAASGELAWFVPPRLLA